MESQASFSSRLRAERERLRLTLTRCADGVGVSVSTWKRWEAATPMPSDKLALLERLEIDAVYVLTGTRARPEIRDDTVDYIADATPSRASMAQFMDAFERADTTTMRVLNAHALPPRPTLRQAFNSIAVVDGVQVAHLQFLAAAIRELLANPSSGGRQDELTFERSLAQKKGPTDVDL